MILFPNCKINLGIHIAARRPDGYHNIETAMLPVRGLCDALEILRSEDDKLTFSSSGLHIDSPTEKNLCVKAWRLMQQRYGISGIKMHLHKHIPFGAGLGGGSADAVFTLKILSDLFNLNLPEEELETLAAQLGSDTAFFVKNRPALATGRGEILTPIGIDLSGYYLLLIKPDITVSTAEAYNGVTPRIPEIPLETILNDGIHTWKDRLTNDFEPSVFHKYPELAAVKRRLYKQGAIYASMSGSGSTVFGLFDHEPETSAVPDDYFVYVEKML